MYPLAASWTQANLPKLNSISIFYEHPLYIRIIECYGYGERSTPTCHAACLVELKGITQSVNNLRGCYSTLRGVKSSVRPTM